MKFRNLIFFIVVLFCFYSCSQKEKDSKSITIGWIGVLTGEAAPYGISVKNGTELALEEIVKSGALDKSISIKYEDDKADPKTGINAINKLISVYNPVVIIQAAASSVMLANIPIAEKSKIVYISPSCSNDKIKEGGDYVFRIWPSDSFQGTYIARYILKEIHLKKAAIIYIKNDFGTGLKNAFKNEFIKIGGEIVAEESFNQDAVEMRTQLSKIKETDAEIVFIPSHVKETVRALKQAKELGITIPFFADAAAFSTELISGAGEAAENLYIANLDWDINSNDPLISNFVKKYNEKFGKSPDIYAAAGYDCLMVIAKAIKKSQNITSENIKNELYKIQNYQGITGKISFDDYGEVEKEYSVYKVNQGKFCKIKM